MALIIATFQDRGDGVPLTISRNMNLPRERRMVTRRMVRDYMCKESGCSKDEVVSVFIIGVTSGEPIIIDNWEEED